MLEWLWYNWHSLLWSAGILAVAIGAALLVRAFVLLVLRRFARRSSTVLGHSLVQRSERPSRWIFPLLAVVVVAPGLPLPHQGMSVIEHMAALGFIAAIAWLLILFLGVLSDLLARRYRIDVSDNLLARRVQTQFQMVHRIAIVLVIAVTLAIMLMTFPAIKHIGMSILASAGLVSLIVGMAMKDTLANLIAGVQIAFAQPFRIGDAVVVEGEWGWIEEIGMMYVVVRIWDLRRLVLPLSYFLDHPFQNWTRTSADLLGHCYIYTDYTVPVEPLRAELRRICAQSQLWSGKVCVLQVSDLFETTMQLRALMDARNSSDAWDLRCLVREKLIDFIQRTFPGGLPRYRGEFLTTVPERASDPGAPPSRPRAIPADTPVPAAQGSLRRSA
jgi:small-conductance mechanosensitive channel